MYNRAEQCRAIAPHGGAATFAKEGVQGMRRRGKVGFAVTAQRYGRHNAIALVRGKGWHGRRFDSVQLDLFAGSIYAHAARLEQTT